MDKIDADQKLNATAAMQKFLDYILEKNSFFLNKTPEGKKARLIIAYGKNAASFVFNPHDNSLQVQFQRAVQAKATEITTFTSTDFKERNKLVLENSMLISEPSPLSLTTRIDIVHYAYACPTGSPTLSSNSEYIFS